MLAAGFAAGAVFLLFRAFGPSAGPKNYFYRSLQNDAGGFRLYGAVAALCFLGPLLAPSLELVGGKRVALWRPAAALLNR